MTVAEMNAQAQATALRLKERFPEMTDDQIIKTTRFIVLSVYTVKETERILALEFGPDTVLTGKGYELIFSECTKEALHLE